METIPIFFTFNRYYVLPAAVAFYSLLKNASKEYKYLLYVLHKELGEKHKAILKNVIAKFDNASLFFIDVSSYSNQINKLEVKSHFSEEIYYKLIAAELFPQYDRILCSDVDVVFEGDISPSYFIGINEFFYFAGVGQILESDRMNQYGTLFTENELSILRNEIGAGYMLLNLKAIRENNIQEKLVDFYLLNYFRLKLPEQDCITLVCWPHISFLPMKYVVCNSYYKATKTSLKFYRYCTEFINEDSDSLQRFFDSLANPVQIHYVGALKPWNSFHVIKRNRWFYYLKKARCSFLLFSELPVFVMQKIKKYNMIRFIKKSLYKISFIMCKN